MRPTKLVMCAFGPYADKTEIDFDKLGTSGVYLVCGDTGAGKTMIFDAISYALFGEASGDAKGGARSTSSLRSDYAQAENETYVELHFDYRGRSYRIKRNPDYMRAKARGTGETKQTAGAEMEFPDGRVVSGIRNVNDAVVDLLGIKSEQFKQIVMLAQGEFRKLLTADTDSREAIFRKLFGTEIYETMQDRFAEESRRLEHENGNVKAQIKAYAGRVNLPSESAAAVELEERMSSGSLLGDWLQRELRLQLEEDELQHEGLQGEVQSLREKEIEANGLLKRVENRPALEREREKLVNEIAQLETQTPSLKDKLSEQEKKDAKRAEAVERAAKIEATIPKYEELCEAEKGLEEANKKLVDARRQLNDAEKESVVAQANVEKLSAAVASLKDSEVVLEKAKASFDAAKRDEEVAASGLKTALELEKKATEASQAKNVYELAKAKKDKASVAESEAQKVLLSASEKLAALGDAKAGLAEARALFEAAEGKMQDAKELATRREKLVRDLGAAKAPCEAAKERYKAAEASHARDVDKLQDLQMRQRAGRAGILAADLKDGDPCPVCGSVHHPSPANVDAIIPSDDEVDAASHAENVSKTEANNLSVEVARLKAVLDEKEKLLNAFDEENGGASGVEEMLDKAKKGLESALEKRKKAEAIAEEAVRAEKDVEAAKVLHDKALELLKAIDEALQKAHEVQIKAESAVAAMRESAGAIDPKEAEGKLAEATRQFAVAKDNVAKARNNVDVFIAKQSELAAAQSEKTQAVTLLEEAKTAFGSANEERNLIGSRVEHLKADLEFPGKKEAEEEAGRLRILGKTLKDARDMAEKALQSNEAEIRTKKELIKQNDRNLAAIPDADVEATRAAMEGFKAEAEKIQAKATQLKTRIDTNFSCLEGLEAALNKAGDIEERYGRVKRLADAATGNLTGKAKVRFEAYVQTIYFDKVIAAANQRLKVLTSGQFELIRFIEEGGKAKAGLGLYVVDSFTGRARDASSLSGGESFQASLCLALGLSDIVQAHAGGIEFDTMFVDEGFGSLDQGALGNAISLLSDLSGGTKLVGIISHVEDLKANIPKKIIVTKDRAGSSVNIEL